MVQTSARVNPFPGLRSFEFGEKYLFFGRNGLADELFARLKQHRFIAVVGPSGSGKSSLVQAGLLPAMYSGHLRENGVHWRTVILRPGGAPLRNLAVGLSRPTVLGGLLESQEETIPLAVSVESTLRQGEMGLAQVVQQAQLQPNENLLIVVDAFEELFRIPQGRRRQSGWTRHSNDPQTGASWGAESEAAAFVSVLLAAVQQRQNPIYVVLTMRSDFIGDCAQFAGLPEAMNQSQYLVPRMTEAQQRAAITGPIDVVRGAIAPRLVDRLLEDIGNNPHRLSVLQHAMMRTWDYWQNHHEPDEPVDIRHYEAVGTMATALSNHADAVFEQLTTRQQDIARQLFQRLTERGEDGRLIRRPTSLFEIARVANVTENEIREVVNHFRGGGQSFLTPPPPEPLNKETVLDISHESLMRTWARLTGWIEEERESVRQYRHLVERAVLHQKGAADLLKDPDLALALNWRQTQQPTIAWSIRYSDGFDDAIAYLQESFEEKERQLAFQNRQVLEQEKQRMQRVERARRVAFGTTVLALGAIAATGLALFKAFEANRARYQVERQLAAREETTRVDEDTSASEEPVVTDEPLFEGEPMPTVGQLSPDEFMSVDELMALEELLADDSIATETVASSPSTESVTERQEVQSSNPLPSESAAETATEPVTESREETTVANGQVTDNPESETEVSDSQAPESQVSEPRLPDSQLDSNRGRVIWEQGLAMRSQPNYEGTNVGGVPFNEIVTLLEVSENGTWQKIRLDSGMEGWVKAGNIAAVSGADAAEIVARDVQSPSPEREPEQPELARRVPVSSRDGNGRVTWPGGLAVRSEPSLNSSYIGGIPFNGTATILEQSEDGRWQRIRQESTGLEGWVKAGNIAVE